MALLVLLARLAGWLRSKRRRKALFAGLPASRVIDLHQPDRRRQLDRIERSRKRIEVVR